MAPPKFAARAVRSSIAFDGVATVCSSDKLFHPFSRFQKSACVGMRAVLDLERWIFKLH